MWLILFLEISILLMESGIVDKESICQETVTIGQFVINQMFVTIEYKYVCIYRRSNY